MTRVTILAMAAAAIILLGVAALNASPDREPGAIESLHAVALTGMIPS